MLAWLTLYGLIEVDGINNKDFGEVIGVVMQYLEIEKALFSMVILVAGISVMYSFRLVPSWGNYVIAVLNTMINTEVALYILVWLMFTFIFGIVFHSLVNMRIVYYSDFGLSIFRSLQSSMDWAILYEDWKLSLDAHYDSTFGIQLILSFFHFLWVIVAIVLINLFIGIVTLKWGTERASSEHEWNKIITQNMAKALKRRIKKNSKSVTGKTNKWANAVFSNSTLFLTNENDMIKSGIRSISTKLRILRGNDGHKFWKKPEETNGSNRKVEELNDNMQQVMLTKFGPRKIPSVK